MATAAEHYSNHLAAAYLWMAGGIEASLESGTQDVESLTDLPADRKLIVDLGAGFGMHAIPLARKGFSVLAIDSSPELLATLKQHCGSLPVKAVEDDLLLFRRHLAESPGAILCMGDTLTHLPDQASVERLIQEASLALKLGGLLVFVFRDYSTAVMNEKRFIPVRSDENRIFTCFLEYEDRTVKVHDILNERGANGWEMKVSWYRKLRLSPAKLAEQMIANGFTVRTEAGARGMVKLVAHKV